MNVNNHEHLTDQTVWGQNLVKGRRTVDAVVSGETNRQTGGLLVPPSLAYWLRLGGSCSSDKHSLYVVCTFLKGLTYPRTGYVSIYSSLFILHLTDLSTNSSSSCIHNNVLNNPKWICLMKRTLRLDCQWSRLWLLRKQGSVAEWNIDASIQ